MNPYDVWAEIDLGAISDNIKGLRRLLSEKTRLMAVVKADAYGHGAVEVAAAAVAAGASVLGVARLGEAAELRHAGIDAPVLIFGHTSPAAAQKLVEYDLIQTVCSYAAAEALSARAEAMGRRIRVHVNVDTGMGRLGFMAAPSDFQGAGEIGDGDPVEEIKAVCRLKGLVAEGIYTHFATADDADKTGARQQFDRFSKMLSRLADAGVEFAVRHAANSAAIIDMPETHLDMVRAGISIYGHYPSRRVACHRVGLTPAMTVKSRIVFLKKVGPGFKVSYGWTAETEKATTIATVAVGYADGFTRLLSAAGQMTVGGQVVPVLGRICMDNTMVDVGRVPDVRVGDSATLFGNPNEGAIPVEDLADALGTIHYEILTMVSGRAQRIYRR
ncbi:MAG: alanine racemase [Thermodesulfobacteriota bacterium]